MRPVIHAGGQGARSRGRRAQSGPAAPLAPEGVQALLEHTLARFDDPLLFEPPIVVCSAAQAEEAYDALKAFARKGAGLIVEPEPCDTAAAAAAAAADRVLQAAPDELLLLSSANHLVTDVSGYRATCIKALEIARHGRLVVFGVDPTDYATVFGLIEPRAEARGPAEGAGFKARPEHIDLAASAAKGALWSMGVLLARASTIVSLLQVHAPDIYDVVSRAVADGERTRHALVLAPSYASARKLPFERAVVDKAQGAAVIRLSVGWDDLTGGGDLRRASS
jgi:mannose-1-phosphate guanylyltransferase